MPLPRPLPWFAILVLAAALPAYTAQAAVEPLGGGRTPLSQPVPVARVLDHGTATRRSVALTFDAGADRGNAEYILDVLLYLGVRASFGMTGVWAQQNPDLVRRMADEGHQLINHTRDHASFTGRSSGARPLTFEQRRAELDATERTLTALTGVEARPFFRPPYGDLDAGVLRDAAALGYPMVVMWTIDSRGWMKYRADAIIARCLAQAAPGAIYVMHVGADSQDAIALPAIIGGLRDADYSFETVAQIAVE